MRKLRYGDGFPVIEDGSREGMGQADAMTDDKPVVAVGRSQKLGAAIYARQVLDGHMAWMKANVRCETCKHHCAYQQGWKGETLETCYACANAAGPWFMSPTQAEDGCTSWEPK